MSKITDTETATYDEMWAVDAYARWAPGAAYLDLFLSMAPEASGTILDAGCGSGKAALALAAAGFTVRLCDLSAAAVVPEAAARFPFWSVALWQDLARTTIGPVDWVYCCDVLEHLPPTFTMLAVSRLLDVATHGVFLSIALVPDQFGAWVGHPLHRTVQTFVEWRDQLAELATIRECRDLLQVGVYLLEPRR